jgi:cytochrome c1
LPPSLGRRHCGRRVRIPIEAPALALQGPFGTYDRASAQRGFQVYKEVCAACHSLSLLPIAT